MLQVVGDIVLLQAFFFHSFWSLLVSLTQKLISSFIYFLLLNCIDLLTHFCWDFYIFSWLSFFYNFIIYKKTFLPLSYAIYSSSCPQFELVLKGTLFKQRFHFGKASSVIKYHPLSTPTHPICRAEKLNHLNLSLKMKKSPRSVSVVRYNKRYGFS